MENPLAVIFSGTYTVAMVVIYVLYVVALWRVFSKAGYPGILAIIPIVNIFLWVKVAGYSAWMTLLLLIPVVGWIFTIVLSVSVGHRFGKGGIWSFFLLWLFSIVGVYILGFGGARHTRRA